MVVNVNPLPPGDLGEWISQAEAARIRRTSRQAIARLIERERLATLEVAGRKLVRRSDVMAFDPLPAGRKPKP